LTETTDSTLKPAAPSNLWRPLRLPTFRNLLIADVVSDIGALMQSVGAAWLMVSLGAGPIYVALTQTASSLPYFLFALPAGSAGDIVDRRRLILFTESWMLGVALITAVLTISGFMSSWLLLMLMFALSAGDAFETPTWRAILPELVPKEDLAPASALNGIEFNLARAVGPALAGVVIAAAGVATAFLAKRYLVFRSRPGCCKVEKADPQVDGAAGNLRVSDRGTGSNFPQRGENWLVADGFRC
jgi:MFS family permease